MRPIQDAMKSSWLRRIGKLCERTGHKFIALSARTETWYNTSMQTLSYHHQICVGATHLNIQVFSRATSEPYLLAAG
jgi:hypothetical protein